MNGRAIKKVVMTETKIYVGLNDSESRAQKFDTGKYMRILREVCRNYHVPFSFVTEEGGYIHEDGEYVQETSLVISFIDVDSALIEEIAKDLCVFFHQESVLITEGEIRAYFINEKI